MQQQTVVIVDPSDLIAASKVTWNLTNRSGYTRHTDKSVGAADLLIAIGQIRRSD